MNTKKRTLFALAVVAISVILDQASKVLAQSSLSFGDYVPLLGDALGFELVHNPGAFLGMFSDARWAFMLPSMLIIAVMTIWLYIKRSPSPLFVVSVSLLIGGGIGNMIDRIFLGYVVDFISFRWIHFPNFNIADSCVTVGCILFAVCALLTKEDVFDVNWRSRTEKPTATNEDSHDL